MNFRTNLCGLQRWTAERFPEANKWTERVARPIMLLKLEGSHEIRAVRPKRAERPQVHNRICGSEGPFIKYVYDCIVIPPPTCFNDVSSPSS